MKGRRAGSRIAETRKRGDLIHGVRLKSVYEFCDALYDFLLSRTVFCWLLMRGAAYGDTGKSACATLRVAADFLLLQNDCTDGCHNFSCQQR